MFQRALNPSRCSVLSVQRHSGNRLCVARPQRRRPCARSTPWRKEDIQQYIVEDLAESDNDIGEAWDYMLPDDVRELYDEVLDAENEWHEQFEMVLQLPKYKQADAYFQNVSVSPAFASEMVGMGSWRLKAAIDPIIATMASRMEGLLFTNLMMELNLYPPEKWKGLFDFMDSMDPKREWDNWAWADIPDPVRKSEDYPRMYLENRIYCSRVFRKIHIEVASRQDGLDVLHVVMYPRYNIDLPILAIDVVVVKGNVTMALVDACPVRSNCTLPPHYTMMMKRLQEAILPDSLRSKVIPEWGKAILSPLCVSIRPQNVEELVAFVRYAFALTNAHLKLSTLARPLGDKAARHVAARAEILASHRRFCEKNLENTKTARALEVAFGKEMTKEYMQGVMFDFDPEDDPEWVDGGVGDLYRYMALNPPKDPVWEEEIEAEKREQRSAKMAQARQLGELQQQLAAVAVGLEHKAEGLTEEVSAFLLDNDPEYREIVEKLAEQVEQYDEVQMEAASEAAQDGAMKAYEKWYVP